MGTSIKYRNLFPVVFILILFSCTEPIDIKLDSSFAKLTVFGEITTDTSVQSVFLTRSADYFYNLPAEGVSGANVKISDGFTETILSENSGTPGKYETPEGYYGLAGRTYQLFIQNVDINKDGVKESFSASSYLPELVGPDSIAIKNIKFHRSGINQILLYAKDPAESKDFYGFKIKKNGVMLTDSLPEINVQNDDLFNGNYINGVPVIILHENRPDEKLIQGDTIVFEMMGITHEYYKFITEAQTELFGSNPLFSGPPANISTNLSNGALGFFAAVNIKRTKTIAPIIP
jgi:hypothetical protein